MFPLSVPRRISQLIVVALAFSTIAVAVVVRSYNAANGHAATAVKLTPMAAPKHVPAYPLQISSNKRYLVDRNHRPFLLLGDSPQAIIVNSSLTDAAAYFANRQGNGFNAVWINLLCSTYNGGRSDGSTYDGLIPFTTPGDLSTPNPAYFGRVDAMLKLAAQHNIVVFLDPIETGGWLDILRRNGTTKAYHYGVYVGKRYKNFPNIVWMSGNDFQSWNNRSDDAVVQAVAHGIKSVDAKHIQTVELNYYTSGSLDDTSWRPIINLDAAYTYFPTYAQVLKEYNRANMPVFMVEAHYDGENVGGEMGTPNVLRRQEYWSMLSGATGQLYGSQYWNLHGDWQRGIDTVGVQQLGYMTSLFRSRAWYRLVPDQKHSVVTAGYGTFSSSGNVSNSDYATTARAVDGSLIIAYLPAPRSVTVNMAELRGPARARWYDPTDGKFSNIAGSPFANRGTRRFMPPLKNHSGDGDWVLLLEQQQRRSH